MIGTSEPENLLFHTRDGFITNVFSSLTTSALKSFLYDFTPNAATISFMEASNGTLGELEFTSSEMSIYRMKKFIFENRSSVAVGMKIIDGNNNIVYNQISNDASIDVPINGLSIYKSKVIFYSTDISANIAYNFDFDVSI